MIETEEKVSTFNDKLLVAVRNCGNNNPQFQDGFRAGAKWAFLETVKEILLYLNRRGFKAAFDILKRRYVE